MEGLCTNCKFINKNKRYGNIFDDKFWYGCKRLVIGITKDEYNKDGSLAWNDTNPRCFVEDLQFKINFDICYDFDNKKED